MKEVLIKLGYLYFYTEAVASYTSSKYSFTTLKLCAIETYGMCGSTGLHGALQEKHLQQ